MATQQISEFEELSDPVDDDYLVIVDASDTTDSPQGTTKKITLANLLAALNALQLETGV